MIIFKIIMALTLLVMLMEVQDWRFESFGNAIFNIIISILGGIIFGSLIQVMVSDVVIIIQ